MKRETTMTRQITMTPDEVEKILADHFGFNPAWSDLTFIRDTNGYVEQVVLTCVAKNQPTIEDLERVGERLIT